MNLKFLKSEDQFYALDYFVYVNNIKNKLGNSLIIQNEDEKCEFYVKTFWAKSKLYKLNSSEYYEISIRNLISKKIYIIFLISFFVLLFSALYFDSSFVWNIIATISVLYLTFQLCIYTIGSKYFIKVDIEASQKANDGK